MKKTFIFYTDRIDYTQEMTNEEKGIFLQTILDYQNWGTGKEIDRRIIFIRTRVKKQLDQDSTKREEESLAKSKAGIEWNKKRWGNRKPSQVIASAIKTSQVVPVNVNVNVNDNENEINTTIVVDTLKKKTPSLDINFLIEEIKKFNNWIIDGTQKEQRQYWNLLLKKIEQVKINDYNWKSIFSMMLEIISKNTYHSHKIVWPKKIYYELSWLLAVCKQDIERQKDKSIPFIPWI